MRSGIVAEFETPEALVAAYERLRQAGYSRLTSWTPYPMRALANRLPQPLFVPLLMLGGALVGAGLAYLIQWWCNGYDYAIDIGARPLDSVPSDIPICFETAVLFASLTGFFALLGVYGFPRLNHPTFEVDGFERASVDRFWLGIDGSDPRIDERLPEELAAMGALRSERLGESP
jgi:hypothetical protein